MRLLAYFHNFRRCSQLLEMLAIAADKLINFGPLYKTQFGALENSGKHWSGTDTIEFQTIHQAPYGKGTQTSKTA